MGNGPYRYLRHVPKTMMELEANPSYFRGRPRIERVVLKFGSPSLTELLSGNVDALAYLNQMELLKIAKDPRFKVYHLANGFDHNVILWNHRHAPFDDPRVRRALTLAIDRQTLRRVVSLPDDLPIVDAIFTQRQFQRGELPPPLPFDPAQARRLLDEAGWRVGNGDGIRKRQGKPLRFTALVPPSGSAGASSLEQGAVYVQAQLRQIGIEMGVRTLETSAIQQLGRAGKFDAAFQRITVSRHQYLFGEQSPIGYVNPEVIGVLKRAAATVTPDELDRLYRELAPIFQRDQPVTYLYPVVWTTVAHRRVRGWTSSYLSEPYWYMEELWLEDGR